MIFKKKNTKYEQGFTLVEFIVIMVVFAIMTSVALFQFGRFRSDTALSNLAYDVALVVRQAQVFGISASESLMLGGQSAASQTRGVSFVYGNNGFESRFIIFSDVDNDATFNKSGTAPGTDFVIDEILIANEDVSILQIVGIPVGKPATSTQTISGQLDITFTRPDPDATIVDASGTFYSEVAIVLTTTDGQEKVIDVFSNGQIQIRP